MKFVITWRSRATENGEENRETGKKSLDAFTRWTPSDKVQFLEFVARVDNRGGFAVVETDDIKEVLATNAKFSAYIEYEVFPVVDVADAAGAWQDAMEFLG
jgi:hypothetical protein